MHCLKYWSSRLAYPNLALLLLINWKRTYAILIQQSGNPDRRSPPEDRKVVRQEDRPEDHGPQDQGLCHKVDRPERVARCPDHRHPEVQVAPCPECPKVRPEQVAR